VAAKSSEQPAIKAPDPIPPPSKPSEKSEPAAAAQPLAGEEKQKSGTEQTGNTKLAQNPTVTKPTQPPALSPPRPANKEGSAAATVEKDVVTAFKNFSAHEKLRAQENQRRIARQDKAVKLNDLKKFAENFKLHTPVPTDLVPILAKDKGKQQQIMKKNQENVEQAKSTPPKQPAAVTAVAASTDKAARAGPPRGEVAHASPITPAERQGQQRGRHNQNNFGQSTRNDRGFQNMQVPNMPGRNQPGNLGARVQNNLSQAQYRQGLTAMAIPAYEPRAPPTGPSATSSGVTSPASAAARFNIKAPEFRPNPAAHTFQPSHSPSSSSSPAREPSNRPVEQKPKKGNFFEGRRPVLSPDKRINIEKEFNPIPRMKKEVESEKTHDGYPWNQGIRPAFHTEPRWPVPKENEEKTYDQMFEQPPAPAPSVSPQHPALAQPPMPHHQQLPMHLQHGGPMPQGHGPQYNARHMPNQPHHVGPGGPHPGHFDDQQMRFTQSTSSVHPSPRALPPFVYSGPGPQGVPIYPNAMPAYGMSPSGHPMAVRQVSSGPQFMAPQGQPMGGHMMTNNPSSGPYMNVPMNAQVQMYSPMGTQVFPQHGGPMPPQQVPNGYHSPARPPAPMMAHQGSQQGHPPQQMVYMQPGGHGPIFNQGPQGPSKYNRFGPTRQPSNGQNPVTPMRGGYGQPHPPQYAASPHQPPMYPVQPHRGTPSATYAQPMMPTHSMPPQNMAPNANAAQMGGEGPEDAK
jgi:hypothetical protein